MILENEQQIDASPSIVWRVTEDVVHWPQWTPTMESVVRLDDGPFDVGSTARIKQPGLPEAVWRVTSLTRGEGFTWEATIRGIRMIATHQLSPCGAGTRNVLRVRVSGLFGVLLWPLISGNIRKAIARENASLKLVCEALMQQEQD